MKKNKSGYKDRKGQGLGWDGVLNRIVQKTSPRKFHFNRNLNN